MTTPSLSQVEQLFRVFRSLPRTDPPERTFMQIAGYPHLENVASNILDFYFNPSNPHGLGTLFLDTLLKLIGQQDVATFYGVDIRREELTANNKRIDLVIETDTMVVAIENKLFHTVVNPFEEYVRHLNELRNERILLCVLLCLRPPPNATNLYSFIPITYKAFFSSILTQLGTPSLLSVREPYFTYLREFIRTLLELGQETTMNDQMLSFFRQHRGDVEGLMKEIHLLREDMRQKTKDLASLIDTSTVGLPITQRFYKDEAQLFHLLVYQILLTERLGLQVHLNISPIGWQINMFNYKGNQGALEAWLTQHGIPIKVRGTQLYRLAYGSDSVSYSSDLTLIAEEVHDLFTKLNQSVV